MVLNVCDTLRTENAHKNGEQYNYMKNKKQKMKASVLFIFFFFYFC